MSNNKATLLPNQKYLRECFDVDIMSGIVTWNNRPIDHFETYRMYNSWNTKYAYERVGCLNGGYWRTSLNGTRYSLHRIIWKWWYGTEPLDIDHIDRCKTNNRIVNLRSVTNRQNCNNRKLHKNNVSGVSGVNPYQNKWVAGIQYEGRWVHLGTYNTVDEAAASIQEFKSL